MSDPFGFLNIDKPAGLTSHDVVNRVRRSLKVKKAGHAGTLDPLATGVLVMGIGHATRLNEYAMASTKRYTADLRFGITTDTYDAEGEVTAKRDPSQLTRQAIEDALPPFRGAIEQVPPMYSAIKQGGRKLYDLARAGETIERPPRPVTIHALELIAWEPPHCTLDVTCSAGTYIRSLAYDLGEALGVGAHLTGLRRTASGDFTTAHAVPLDDLLTDADWQRHLLPPDVAVQALPALPLDAIDSEHVRNGRSITSHTPGEDDTLARAYDDQRRFVAIMRAERGQWRPHKVFL